MFTRELLVVEDGKEAVLLTITVGQPYWLESQDDAGCQISIKGYRELEAEIIGINPLQALALALGAIEIILEPIESKLYWKENRKYVPP